MYISRSGGVYGLHVEYFSLWRYVCVELLLINATAIGSSGGSVNRHDWSVID